jgi:hypothetical protein
VIIKKNALEYELKIIDYESVIKKEDDYGTFYTHGYMDFDVIANLEERKLIKNPE